MILKPPVPSVHGILQARILESGWLRGLSGKGTQLQKKNTGAGGHSLLQEIFLIQGSNPSLLHCRQIVYHWATRILQLHTYIYFICLMRYIYDYNWKWRVTSQGWRVLTLPLQSAVRVLLSSFQPCPSFCSHFLVEMPGSFPLQGFRAECLTHITAPKKSSPNHPLQRSVR